MNRILITGATGLIGYEFISQFKNAQDIYVVIQNNEKATQIPHNIHPVFIDLSSDWNKSSLPQNVDAVVHLAQSPYYREFPNYAENVFNTNTMSTLKLLDYAVSAGVKKFIYASSGGIYGKSESEFKEDMSITAQNDLGFYLSTKFCSEIISDNFTQFFDIILLRFFFVYGKRQKKTMLIPRLIHSVKEGIPILLQGEEGIKINPIHVSDAAAALHKALSLKGSHKINVAGPQVLSLNRISTIIGEKLDKKPVFKYESKEPHHLIGNIEKLSGLLHSPKIFFDQAVDELILESE